MNLTYLYMMIFVDKIIIN